MTSVNNNNNNNVTNTIATTACERECDIVDNKDTSKTMPNSSTTASNNLMSNHDRAQTIAIKKRKKKTR